MVLQIEKRENEMKHRNADKTILDVVGYVKKPYDPQELLERIEKFFNEDL